MVNKPSPIGSTYTLDPPRQLLIIYVLGFRDTIHFPLSLVVQIQPCTSGPGAQSKIFLLPSIPTLSTLICACVHAQLLQSCPILWTVVRQAPLSMGFSRQEYWSGLPCPPPGDLLDLGIKPMSLMPPALQVGSLLLSHRGSPHTDPTNP